MIIVIAVNAPFKKEDQRVGPLSKSQVTLGELITSKVIYPAAIWDPTITLLKITLPSTNPTVREVMHAISQQSGMRTSLYPLRQRFHDSLRQQRWLHPASLNR